LKIIYAEDISMAGDISRMLGLEDNEIEWMRS
ncbi:hypothetical protein LCGC14_1676250, partial [marine sediment metagenome]